MTLFLVDDEVKEGMPLDGLQLDELARHLCHNLSLHDMDRSPVSQHAEEAFEKQVEESGYCDVCRDIAGRIVVEFSIERRRP